MPAVESPPSRANGRAVGLASCAILAAGAIAAYGRTFSVPLLLDDFGPIADNPSIRRLWPLLPVLSPPIDTGVGGRPVVNLSYALNYAAGGTAVSGYHLVNLLIHILACWTLFALVRRTLRRPLLADRFGGAANSLALAVSAIWAWHPLQTESVTYISERAESLMGLFYLLTLYSFVRYADETKIGKSGNRESGKLPDRFSLFRFPAFPIFFCLLGMATKEVMVTAPLMALLYDRTFISGSFSESWRRHRSVFLGLAATWLPLGCLMIGLRHREVGFGQGVSLWAYGLTECRVVVKYLLLAFWPKPLVFDYGGALAAGLSAVWPYLVVLASLLAATLVALRRSPAAGFAASWFFVVLAPTSSIVPIVGQTMAENRMYLPLAGVCALAVLGAFALAGRRTLPVFAVVAVALGLASARRNQDYSSAQAIWSDTVAKNPDNPRAHDDLGDAWLNMPGRMNDAITQYEEALRLKPDYADALVNLGNILQKGGRNEEAIADYEKALSFKPRSAEAHYDLGIAWAAAGRLVQATSEFRQAVQIKPDYADAHSNLGAALANAGRMPEGIAELEEAARLDPGNAQYHYNLGLALREAGREDEAAIQLEEAARLRQK